MRMTLLQHAYSSHKEARQSAAFCAFLFQNAQAHISDIPALEILPQKRLGTVQTLHYIGEVF